MITGYRELSTEELKQINAVKAYAAGAGEMIGALRARPDLYDQRWVSIAQTHLQEGFMAAVRSIAQPTTF